MKMHYDPGDALMANVIAVRAREISKVYIEQGSHKDKIQSTKLKGSAFCVIEAPLTKAPARNKD
jgi:hypothetical protein